MITRACMAAAVLLAVATSAQAATVVGTVSGPGGSGAVTVDENGQIHVSKTFTSMNYLDLTITIPAGVKEDEYFGEQITNATGLDWKDFHYYLITPAPPASYIDVLPYAPFTTLGGNLTAIDLSGGTVSNGSVFAPILGVHIVDPQEFGYTYTIRQIPSIPEPNTWALLLSGFGLAGGLLRRRRALAASTCSPWQGPGRL